MSKSQVYTELKFVYACNNACHESLLSESGFSTKHSHGCMHACILLASDDLLQENVDISRSITLLANFYFCCLTFQKILSLRRIKKVSYFYW